MKYRYFWAMLFCFALLLSGCGAETNTDAVQPDVPDASSEAAQPDAAPADGQPEDRGPGGDAAGGVHALVRRAGDRRRDRTPRF